MAAPTAVEDLASEWNWPDATRCGFVRLVADAPSGKRHAGQFSELRHQLVLKARIRHFLRRGLRPAVMPVSAADRRRGIVAHGKPRLREISLLEIVRRTRTAHLRRNPARDRRHCSARRASVARPRTRVQSDRACCLNTPDWSSSAARSNRCRAASATPPRCMPLLRYTNRRGRSISAVSM